LRAIRIAKPYGKALYEASVEQNVLDDIVTDVHRVVELMRDSEEFEQFVINPMLSPQIKSDLLQQLLGEAVHPLLVNFLLLLAAKQRERLLVSILQTFLEIVDLRANRLIAQVTSAVPINDAQQTSLVKELSEYSGKEVRLELSEDVTVKGGIVVRLGDTVFDGSVTAQLQRMKDLLASGQTRKG